MMAAGLEAATQATACSVPNVSHSWRLLRKTTSSQRKSHRRNPWSKTPDDPLHCITVLVYYCITVMLYYCIVVLLYYCITVSLDLEPLPALLGEGILQVNAVEAQVLDSLGGVVGGEMLNLQGRLAW